MRDGPVPANYMKKKSCYSCKQSKSIELFVKDKYTKDGYKFICKKCSCDKTKAYHAKDPAKSRAKLYAWRDKNRQYWLGYLKHMRGKNPTFVPKERDANRSPEEARQWVKDNKAQYDVKNKDKNRSYQKAHQPIINQRAREWRRAQRLSNPQFRLMENLRRRFYDLVKKLGHKRSLEYVEMIGCSLDELKAWIENHFEPGMNWENQGHFSFDKQTWQLDHHYPCSAFDLSDPEQQKQCFHHTNVYPVWARENLDKRDSIPNAPKENLHIPAFATALLVK